MVVIDAHCHLSGRGGPASKLIEHMDAAGVDKAFVLSADIENAVREFPDRFIPFNALDQLKSELPNNKDAKIVVYCMSGPMGDIAAAKLLKMGYTEVSHFQGGMQAWKNAGKQLLSRPQ